MTSILLGVDGGKSKTVCLAVDLSGHVRGWGRSGSSDIYDVPFEQALNAVEACARQALAMARAPESEACACFGLAGADWPEDFDRLRAGLAERKLARRLVVKNDATIALRANAPEGYGVVISAGTHLAAAIRTPGGEEWHSAWFSVEGAGGVYAGHRVLWAVLNELDGRGAPTALTKLVLEAKGLAHPLELLRLLSQGGIDDVYKASLAPMLFIAQYRYEDAVATGILQEIAGDMARWPLALLRRYGLLDESIPVILSGGLFKGEGGFLIDAVTTSIDAFAPQAQVRLAQREPVSGAVLVAAEISGLQTTPGFLEELDTSMPQEEFFHTWRGI